MTAEGGLLLLDEPGEPLGVYLRHALEAEGALGDGSGGVVLPVLTGQTICQVYAGVCVEPQARQVLEALLASRPVWTPEEGLSDLGSGPLGRLVRERLYTLRRAGLRVCPLGRLAALAARGGERDHGAGPGPRFGLVYQKIR